MKKTMKMRILIIKYKLLLRLEKLMIRFSRSLISKAAVNKVKMKHLKRDILRLAKIEEEKKNAKSKLD